jgi:hypothetical protein
MDLYVIINCGYYRLKSKMYNDIGLVKCSLWVERLSDGARNE